ncbi:MAG: dTDP-4-dehydrorhamnose reductase [Desulfobacteraceae bacterium]|jgi:dTDP-4-dehydrorhamnose reductase|nr:dTDP-4-dehydrorhamnose reductase [Desulfobacteraceae bacterium]
MKLLITGAHGQLGRSIIDASQSKGCRVQAPPEEDLDITDHGKVDHIITDLQPDIVINTAAYTQVDKAETEETLAFKINKTGCTHLARTCAEKQIPLVHISTDYVFDGQKDAPYLETDPMSPIGVYGRSKAEGEIEIRSILKEHIILRTSWLYGIHGQNFVKTMLRLATGQKEIRVVADQYGCPTNSADLAQAILTICDYLYSKPKISWGTFHYCGSGVISWHTFAEKIMELTRLHQGTPTARAEPVTTAEYPTRAARPIYSALDCSRITRHFGIRPRPWQISLEKTVRQLLATP